MIINSIPLMTAFDIMIIAVTIYAITRSVMIIRRRRPAAPLVGLRLVTIGLFAISLFYVGDLASMYILPAVASMPEAMAFMNTLHTNLSWPFILFSMVSVSIGFVQVQDQEAKLRRLFDSSIIGIFIWRADGQINNANDAFLRVVGYCSDDFVSGRVRWKDLTPAEWRNADDRSVAELNATGIAQPYEKEYVHKSGNRVPVLVGTAILERDVDEAVTFVVDLTDRKKAEMAEREIERRYREALEHVNRVATMGQLSASIAHEINQPLAAVRVNGESGLRWLDRSEPNVPKARESLERILADGRRAIDIIERIRATTAGRAPQRTALALHEVVEESILFLRHELQSKGVSISLDLAPGLPRVTGDRTQLQQVMVNLAMNAVQAMAQSTTTRRSILIRTMLSDPGTVCCAIEDSGPGIDPSHLAHIFVDFFTTKDTGMGMGLPISRFIVEAHGGHIQADNISSLGGARFRITLPANAGGD